MVQAQTAYVPVRGPGSDYGSGSGPDHDLDFDR